MALNLSNIATGNVIQANDVHQYGDLLLGTMTDQPVTLKNAVAIGGNQGTNAVPLIVNGVAAQAADMFDVKDSGATVRFGVDSIGQVTVNPSSATATSLTVQANGLGLLAAVGVATAVNSLRISNAITGAYPFVQATGSDASVGFDIHGRNNSADAVFVRVSAPGGANVANYIQLQPSVAGGTVSISALGTDVYTTLGFQVKSNNAAANALVLSNTGGAVAANYVQIANNVTGASPSISTQGTDTNAGLDITSKGTGIVNLNVSGRPFFQALPTGATDVNYLQALSTPTGSSPALRVAGSDVNVGLDVTSKGTGIINLNVSGRPYLQCLPTGATDVNYLQVISTPSGTGPALRVASGSGDANANIQINPKGTGSVTSIGGFSGQFLVATGDPGAGTANTVTYLNTSGIGNGALGNIQVAALGTGGGPTNPQVVTAFVKCYVGTGVRWIPVMT